MSARKPVARAKAKRAPAKAAPTKPAEVAPETELQAPPPPPPPAFAVGDRVALVGVIIDHNHSFGRFTVRLDTPGIADNPFDLVCYERNLKKE